MPIPPSSTYQVGSRKGRSATPISTLKTRQHGCSGRERLLVGSDVSLSRRTVDLSVLVSPRPFFVPVADSPVGGWYPSTVRCKHPPTGGMVTASGASEDRERRRGVNYLEILVPLVVLLSYVLRITIVAQRTVAVTPFTTLTQGCPSKTEREA